MPLSSVFSGESWGPKAHLEGATGPRVPPPGPPWGVAAQPGPFVVTRPMAWAAPVTQQIFHWRQADPDLQLM